MKRISPLPLAASRVTFDKWLASNPHEATDPSVHPESGIKWRAIATLSRGRSSHEAPGGGTLPFKVFLGRLYRAQDDHGAFDTAAQLSYYLILSLFPFLFVLAALLAYLPLGDAQAQLIGRMQSLMPPAAR